jgi:hypothetical protein
MKGLLKIILIMMMVALSGCFTSRSSLRDIRENPDKYSQREVVVEGVVIDSLPSPVSPGYLYRIYGKEDSSIWIYTEGTGPVRGSRVRVKGVVSHKDSIRTKIVGPYLTEKSRRTR